MDPTQYPLEGPRRGAGSPGGGEIHVVLILKDDEDRIRRFTLVLRSIEPALPIKVWRNAYSMSREIDCGNVGFAGLDNTLTRA
jgi:hypothetical protein